MKTLFFVLLALQLVSSARAETVRITDSIFAQTTVAVSNSSFAKYQVYFTKSPVGADCGIHLTDSAFAQRTVRIVKNSPFVPITVREVDAASKANLIVYVSKTGLRAFGHCDFAAALLVDKK